MATIGWAFTAWYSLARRSRQPPRRPSASSWPSTFMAPGKDSFVLALAAAALGVLSASELGNWIAPFVAAVTTVGASVAALGMVDRQQFLATSYAGMAQQTDRLDALHREGALSDAELVPAGEDLMSSEHRAWADRMAQLRAPLPPAPTSPPAGHPRPDTAI
jgi:hypothetical protein